MSSLSPRLGYDRNPAAGHLVSCLGDDTILGLVRGDLTGAALTAAEHHLSTCARCRADVGASARLVSTADPLSRGEERDAPRGPLLARGTAIGRYTVVDVLGAGAAAVVYVAHDAQLRRRIALKVLHADGDSARDRWLREAQAMAQLAHPNVVTVHDAGVHDRFVYIAMELVGGQTLADWLVERRRALTEVLPVFVAAGRGLAAAHAAGLVHRDFKPRNVLLGDDGRPRVTDFGLARTDGGEEQGGTLGRSAGGLTAAGALVGTPAYMAPEQFAGGGVDARADQFAFCVALYEALCGRRPFDVDGPPEDRVPRLAAAVQAGHVAAPPADARVPAWLMRIVRRGLAVRPADRFPDMNALLAALERGARAHGRRPVTRAAAAVTVLTAFAAALLLRASPPARCGDGAVGPGEECDDGNASDGDGCTARCLACAGANSFVGKNGHCYTRSDGALARTEAAAACDARGAQLVSYASGYEVTDVWQGLLGGGGPIWTGHHLEAGVIALETREPIPQGTFFWQLAATPVEGKCVAQTGTAAAPDGRTDAVFARRPCDEAARFVCERTPWSVRATDGHAYQVVWSQREWEPARAHCERLRAHLVTIRDPEEQAFVRALVPGPLWIGATDRGGGLYRWVTGEPFTFHAFAPNEPDRTSPDSHCAAIDVDGSWHDRTCGVRYPFVCERQ